MEDETGIRWWQRCWREVLQTLFPWSCPLCRGNGRHPTGLCDSCLTSLGFSPAWRCQACGRPLPATGAACCPQDKGRHLDGLLAAVDYNAAARRAVHQFKYGRHALSGHAMGEILARAAAQVLDIPCRLVIPVPLSPGRQRERGYNHAGLLARRLGHELGLPVEYGLLVRKRETSAQMRLPASQRRRNVAGAFGVRRRHPFLSCPILLVDDVFTTGATIDECARTLKEAGAGPVVGAVFACTPRRDREETECIEN